MHSAYAAQIPARNHPARQLPAIPLSATAGFRASGQNRRARQTGRRTPDPSGRNGAAFSGHRQSPDRKSTRLNSSHVSISYAVFCLKKKKEKRNRAEGEQYVSGELRRNAGKGRSRSG